MAKDQSAGQRKPKTSRPARRPSFEQMTESLDFMYAQAEEWLGAQTRGPNAGNYTAQLAQAKESVSALKQLLRNR